MFEGRLEGVEKFVVRSLLLAYFAGLAGLIGWIFYQCLLLMLQMDLQGL